MEVELKIPEERLDIIEMDVGDLPDALKNAPCVSSPNRYYPCAVEIVEPQTKSFSS